MDEAQLEYGLVWITGASGFVGRRLCQMAAMSGLRVVASSRHAEMLSLSDDCQLVAHGRAIQGVGIDNISTVFHVAARAHQLHAEDGGSLSSFQETNVDMSLAVARAAASVGAKRMIFVSSIGVNGEFTTGVPFRETDVPNPVEPYAISKLQAELELREACPQLGLELVIVRPPLVYGLGAPGNFARLLKLACSGVPLPLAAVRNQRSFIALDNLCDFLLLAARHPSAKNKLFLIADGEDISTPQLIRHLARAAGRASPLWSLPPALLRQIAFWAGHSRSFDKLCGSLQVDNSFARTCLGWNPPISLLAGLASWAQHATK